MGKRDTICSALDIWLAELEIAGASPRTIANYRAVVGEAARHITDRHGKTITLDAVSRDDISHAVAAYQSRPDGRTGEARRRSPGAVSTFHAALRSFFTWCVEAEKLTASPMTRIKAPRTTKRVPKAMSAEECHLLLDAAGASASSERDRLIILLGMTMGLRLAEIAQLRISSLRPDATAPTHLHVLGKGSKERVVPVPTVVRDQLEAYLPWRDARLARWGSDCDALLVATRRRGGRCELGRDGVAEVFERALSDTGLKQPGRRAHVARHSFATHVLQAGADVTQVAELLGHASVSTTQGYLKVDPTRLSAAVEASPLARR
jgi:site-specific recombinase XerD